MQLDAGEEENMFYKPPVAQPAGSQKPVGDTAVDRARARIDDDSD